MKIVIELPDDKATTLRGNAERLGVSAEVYARQMIERDLKSQENARSKMRHISEVMAEIMAGLPPAAVE